LEQFVARSAPENAMKLSPRLKKIRKIDPSSPGDIERDKLDASLLVLSEEPYYDDYSNVFFFFIGFSILYNNKNFIFEQISTQTRAAWWSIAKICSASWVAFAIV
jgi:hypothetical protein